jgi:hypothetical protein
MSSLICCLGMPKLEEISAGENPSEIKAAIRRVAFPVLDKPVQVTELWGLGFPCLRWSARGGDCGERRAA